MHMYASQDMKHNTQQLIRICKALITYKQKMCTKLASKINNKIHMYTRTHAHTRTRTRTHTHTHTQHTHTHTHTHTHILKHTMNEGIHMKQLFTHTDTVHTATRALVAIQFVSFKTRALVRSDSIPAPLATSMESSCAFIDI